MAIRNKHCRFSAVDEGGVIADHLGGKVWASIGNNSDVGSNCCMGQGESKSEIHAEDRPYQAAFVVLQPTKLAEKPIAWLR